ncbi:hypothetical protein FJZ31_14755 [Candidatus Poribacteria bacterium]|nr:hypothetical protein [Candidatus Poribacteria bacterium]
MEGFIFCNSLMDINTENIEQEEQILLSLYKELSETHKRKAIDFLESLVEEETNEDIKHALLQAVQELLMGTR